MSNTMRTRSKARAESTVQPHLDDSSSSRNALEVRSVEDPVPKVLETGLPTKRRRGNEVDARKHRTRSQPLGNRVPADSSKNALEVHAAEDPLPKVLDIRFTRKRRSRKVEDVRKHKTRSQPVDNRVHADCFKNALEVHPAEDPLPQVLETGFTTKRRRRKEEDSQKHRTRSQPVGNRIHADTLKIQRRTAARVKQIDLELMVLGKRKKKMTGSLRKEKPVKRGRGDEEITQSINVSEGLSRDEKNERVEGSSTIGIPLEGEEEQRYSRPMTAKMRWKDRARGLINENRAGPTTSIGDQTPYGQQDIAHHPCQAPPSAHESLPCEKLKAATFLEERGHQIGNVGNGEQLQNRRKLKIAKQQASKTKRQQRACKKRIGILKKLKLWANQTKILKNTVEHDGDSTGDTEWTLVMTENDRENFVQKMVEKCRNNRDLGSSFLESVKMLVNSGLMHSAASTLLKEASCEEAQVVVKAWEKFKLQQSEGKGTPMDLLNAVAELHEKRKDLAGELARCEGPESCSLRQIHESTWQIQIRNCG